MNIDDVKVLIASVAGLGNWLVDIDLILKIVLSAASLVYVVLQIIKHLKSQLILLNELKIQNKFGENM